MLMMEQKLTPDCLHSKTLNVNFVNISQRAWTWLPWGPQQGQEQEMSFVENK